MDAPAQGYRRHWAAAKVALGLWRQARKGQGAQAALRLASHLGGLKGPLLKIGQLTAMVPGLVPAALEKELGALCANAPPMGWPFVRRRLAHELGPTWQRHFQWFTQQASFAASLGQVHQACLQDGRLVACKIQYPGMDQVVHTDLQYISWLAKGFEVYTGALETQFLQQELQERLQEEIDYLQEGRHMRWFSFIFAQDPDIHVPCYFQELSTPRLLTMSWQEGLPLSKALTTVCPHRLGKLIFKAWYKPFYQCGILHGDPHLGNMTWSEKGLNLLDFGCVRLFSPSFVSSVKTLYHALQRKDPKQLVKAYRGWGFRGPFTEEVVEALTLWAQFLFAPFLKNQECSLEEVSSPEKGKTLGLKILKMLALQGGLAPPQEFLIMDRVAVVVGSVLIRLGARANWHRLFEEIVEEYDEERCAKSQAHILAMKEGGPLSSEGVNRTS